MLMIINLLALLIYEFINGQLVLIHLEYNNYFSLSLNQKKSKPIINSITIL